MYIVYHLNYLGILSFFLEVLYNFMCLEALQSLNLFLGIWFFMLL